LKAKITHKNTVALKSPF